MQPRLTIKILPRKSQVVTELGSIAIHIFIGGGGTEGVALPTPHHFVGCVCYRSWGVEVVGVEAVVVALLDDGDG